MLRRIKELIKNTIAETLYVTGAMRLLLAVRFRGRGAILMYHRVLPEGPQTDSFTADSIRVTPEEFDWQMELIGRYLRPMSLGALQRAFERPDVEIPSRACVVTFDDGWFDNSAYALPILLRRRVPAVIFVATGYVGTNDCFWQEKFSRLLHEAWRNPSVGAELLPDIGASHLAGTAPHEIRSLARAFISTLKTKPPAEIERLLTRARAVASAHGIDASRTGDDRFMPWDDVLTVSRSELVDVMSHAVSHTPLNRLSEDAVLRELTNSRATIEAKTATTVEALAYPNGDFDDRVLAATRRAGYRIALTTVPGPVRKSDDPLCLPRINIQSSAARTPARFLCRVAGLF